MGYFRGLMSFNTAKGAELNKTYKAMCILGVWEYSNIGDRDLEKQSILFANRLILRIMFEKHGFQANRKILA